MPTYLTHVSNPDAPVILGCDSAGYCKQFLYVLVNFQEDFHFFVHTLHYETYMALTRANQPETVDEGQSA